MSGTKVVIFGTGSFAEVVHYYLTHDSEMEVVAFTVHRDHIKEATLLGLPVVPFEEIETAFPPGVHKMFVAVGYKRVNQLRAQMCVEARNKGFELVSYVCSKATVWPNVEIGDNCFIFEDNTIQPFVKIGNNVVLWSGNHIGHHSVIGSNCFVTSHAVISGHVRVGDYCFIGVNATLRDSIEIGESCVLGAGALIMKSTRPKEVYVAERTKPFPKSSDEIDM